MPSPRSSRKPRPRSRESASGRGLTWPREQRGASPPAWLSPSPASSIFRHRVRMSQAMLRPLPERAPAPALDGVPVSVGGKFFFVGSHKVYVRGVSYGPFGTSDHGFPFPAENVL